MKRFPVIGENLNFLPSLGYRKDNAHCGLHLEPFDWMRVFIKIPVCVPDIDPNIQWVGARAMDPSLSAI
jgi:hypothetical protein